MSSGNLSGSLIESRFRTIVSSIAKWLTSPSDGSDPKKVHCFISYAWTPSETTATENGISLTEKDYSLQDWLKKIQGDLLLAGITVQLDVTHLEAGHHIETYMKEGIERADFGLVIGTPFLKIRGTDSSTNLAFELAELEKKREANSRSVIGILRVGQFPTSFPDHYLNYLLEDFSDDESYFRNLLKLIGTLYGVTHSDFFKSQIQLFNELVEQASKKVWNVSINQKNFVARESEMEILANACQPPADPNQVRKVFVVTGGGGTGKSQLVRRFVNQYSDRFQFGWWINAETENSLLAGLVDLATTLALFPLEDQAPKEIAEKLVVLLGSKKELFRWLLVFDNVETDLADIIFQKFVPGKGGLAMITSRNTMKRQLVEEEITREEGNVLKVNPFSVDDACVLLERITRKPVDQTLRKIAEILGGLPLAINQAGSFIRENDCPLEEFLELLQTQDGSLIQEEEDFKAVSSTLLLSITHIQKVRPSSLSLLQKVAFFGPDDIPATILVPPERDRLTLEERKSLGFFENFSMINLNDKGDRFGVHRLMQGAIRSHCVPAKLSECTEPADCVRVLLDKAVAVMKEKDQGTADITRRRDLIPHVEHLLKHAEAVGLGGSSSVAQLLYHYSITEFRLGNALKRKTLLTRALKIQQQLTGIESKEVVPFLAQFGGSLNKVGDPRQGLEVLEQALVILTKTGGRDTAEAAEILTNLGIAYGEVGDPGKKKDCLESALEVQERLLGKDHFQVSKTLANLGMAYGSLGLVGRQKEVLERALHIKEAKYGPNHYEVGKTLTNLAGVYGAMRDILKQKELLERSLAIKEQHYGKEHASVSTTLMQLGIACGDLGDFENEEVYLQRCLAIREASFGKDNFKVAVVVSNMAKGKLQRKDYEGAKELATKALVVQERHYGKDTEDVAKTLSTLGCALLALGETAKGKEYLERALVAFRELYQEVDHPSIKFCKDLLGNLESGVNVAQEWVKVKDPETASQETSEEYGSWLLKFGGSFIKREFQWRYFTYPKREGILKWSVDPKGPLRNSLEKTHIEQLKRVSKKESGRDFCFALEGAKLKRTYILVAADAEIYEKWISLLSP